MSATTKPSARVLAAVAAGQGIVWDQLRATLQDTGGLTPEQIAWAERKLDVVAHGYLGTPGQRMEFDGVVKVRLRLQPQLWHFVVECRGGFVAYTGNVVLGPREQRVKFSAMVLRHVPATGDVKYATQHTRVNAVELH
jgi:hypothetical protein